MNSSLVQNCQGGSGGNLNKMVGLSTLKIWHYRLQYLMRKPTQWTQQEDQILMELLSEAKCFQKWRFVSQELSKKGIVKNETKCRDRFINKLNPDLRRDKLDVQELRTLFTHYDEYGPLWSVFESLIPGRNQNLLKNKFYSALRSGIRLICLTAFKKCGHRENFSFASVTSTLLVDIYEGRKGFKKYKGLVKKCFRKLSFEFGSQKEGIVEEVFGQQNLLKIATQISELMTSPTSRVRRRSRNKNKLQKDQVKQKNRSLQKSSSKDKSKPALREAKRVLPEVKEEPISVEAPNLEISPPGINKTTYFYYPVWNSWPKNLPLRSN